MIIFTIIMTISFFSESSTSRSLWYLTLVADSFFIRDSNFHYSTNGLTFHEGQMFNTSELKCFQTGNNQLADNKFSRVDQEIE